MQVGANLKLLPTKLKKKDMIRVMGGEFRGQTGHMLNMADADAIVKLDDGEMKVMDKGFVGLLYGRVVE